MKKTFKHITPRYIYDRLNLIIDEKINPQNPWINSKAVFLLDQLIKPGDIGVEFGSGRSTIWFARRLKHLTSIEDSSTWFSKVEMLLLSSNLKEKVDYRLIKDDAAYSGQTETFQSDSIDFCLIDSKDRDKCALGMIPKLKHGGILVVDNVNWFLPNDRSRSPNGRRNKNGAANENWQQFLAVTKGYRSIWTSDGVSDACIYIKT